MVAPGRFNPSQMARMMKQLGITVHEIDGVEEVVIRTRTKEIVITKASVSAMDAQGQRTWQVTGEATERAASGAAAPAAPTFSNEDIALVMTQAGVSREKAVKALEDAGGEPAAAILSLVEGA